AQRTRKVTRHLGDLETVGEPIAHEVVGLWAHDLGLGRQPPGRGRVHDTGAITFERHPPRGVDSLGGFGDDALARVVVIQVLHCGRRYRPPPTRLLSSTPSAAAATLDSNIQPACAPARTNPARAAPVAASGSPTPWTACSMAVLKVV